MSDLTDALQEVAGESSGMAYVQVGAGDLGDDLVEQLNERAVTWAADNAADLVSQVSDTTRDDVRQAIVDGLDGNLSTDEIADTIGELGAFDAARADLIANTEIANANSAGALEGYQAAADAGVDVKKEWLLGPSPCPVCQENADAGPIDLDEEFPSGDLFPTAHPRCECALSPVIADDDSASQDQGDLAQASRAMVRKYNDDEPRDERGRWTGGGGGGAGSAASKARTWLRSATSKQAISEFVSGIAEKIKDPETIKSVLGAAVNQAIWHYDYTHDDVNAEIVKHAIQNVGIGLSITASQAHDLFQGVTDHLVSFRRAQLAKAHDDRVLAALLALQVAIRGMSLEGL